MDLTFALTVIFISLSGVMAPGPLFAATIAEGRRRWFAGFLISTGHAIVEIPIILILYIFGSRIATDTVKAVVGVLGGIVLLYLAYLEIRSPISDEGKPVRGIITGILMSSLNPYFIIWWLTVGFTLVLKSMEFGLIGLIMLIILHELCDYSWLGFVSITSNGASHIWGERAKLILKAISVSIFIVFGFWFLLTGTTTLLKLHML